MKSIVSINLFLAALIVAVNAQAQTIIVSGVLNTNTTWNADTVKITGNIEVPYGITLTVSPGTYIESQAYFKLHVKGSIKAIGTATDTIVFTVLDTTHFWQDTNSIRGGWNGIWITGNNLSADTSVFEYCTLKYGKKHDWYGGDINGGAIYAVDYGSLLVSHSRFESNMVICYVDGSEGPSGGAIYCNNVNKVVIENCNFARNRSFHSGGAIQLREHCNALINNNVFTNNLAIYWKNIAGINVIGGVGAAIASSDAFDKSPVLSNNIFYNNVTNGGIIYTSNRNCLIYNNLIYNNNGSGYMDGHQLSVSRVYNNTIVNNRTIDGAMTICSRAEIYNNICWNNIAFHGYVCDQIHVLAGLGMPKMKNNCVQYGNGGPSSNSKYPEFIQPSAVIGTNYGVNEADWSLNDWSPCVNSGTADTTGLYLPAHDLAMNPRIYGVSIDMGCFENQWMQTGMENETVSAAKGSLFPNPGTTQLKLNCSDPEAIFELISITGKLVLRVEAVNGENIISTNNVAPAVYLYRISDKSGNVIETGKWIRE